MSDTAARGSFDAAKYDEIIDRELDGGLHVLEEADACDRVDVRGGLRCERSKMW